jgi:hypothetical protein
MISDPAHRMTKLIHMRIPAIIMVGVRGALSSAGRALPVSLSVGAGCGALFLDQTFRRTPRRRQWVVCIGGWNVAANAMYLCRRGRELR